jgi:uncharacterized protein
MKSSASQVQLQWGVKILLRDGIHLNATLYLPRQQKARAPTLVTLTPYIAQSHHDRGLYFARYGYPSLTVDVRGRGNSEGTFKPLIGEAEDAFDVVEWAARQPYCNGQVAMWGGSYGGYIQWACAKEFPSHLAAIVPVASPTIGVDFPLRRNIAFPYAMQWLTLVWGRTSQDKLFYVDPTYWWGEFRRYIESGIAYKDLDRQVGSPSEIFQEWVRHPQRDEYWDRCNPTAGQYRELNIPILTITGMYDANQLGALTHYKQHVKHCSPAARARHYLVIGPWDHAGTRTPAAEFGGLKVGSASLIDLSALHAQWYAWAMQSGPKPEFLRMNVVYYVTGAEKWRYAQTLEAVTAHSQPLYLQSLNDATDLYRSGELLPTLPARSAPDCYVYDPRDVSLVELESTIDPEDCVDQRMLHASAGKQLVYHSEPFKEDTQISGFFKLSLWLAIDQPDTDFRVAVYEIGLDGRSILLTFDWMRARYRESEYRPKLIDTNEPLLYELDRFRFVSRQVGCGHRLRLVVGPLHSIYAQKNYNSGRPVSDESMADARTVTVLLHHDEAYPSVLHVPMGQPPPPKHRQ